MTTYPIHLKRDLHGWVKNSKKLMPPRLGRASTDTNDGGRDLGEGREFFKFGYQSDISNGTSTADSTSIYEQTMVGDHGGTADVFYGEGCYRLKPANSGVDLGIANRSNEQSSYIEQIQDSCVLPGALKSDRPISNKNCQGFLLIEEDHWINGLRSGQVCFQSGCRDSSSCPSSPGLVNEWSQDDPRYAWKRLAGTSTGAGTHADAAYMDMNDQYAAMHEYIDVDKIVTATEVAQGKIYWNDYEIYEPKKMHNSSWQVNCWWSVCPVRPTIQGGTNNLDTSSWFNKLDNHIARFTNPSAIGPDDIPVANDMYHWPFFSDTSNTLRTRYGDSLDNIKFLNNSQHRGGTESEQVGFRGEGDMTAKPVGHSNLSISQAMRKCNETPGCKGFMMYENDWVGGGGDTNRQPDLNGDLFPGSNTEGVWSTNTERNCAPQCMSTIMDDNHDKYYSNFVIFVDTFGDALDANGDHQPDERPTDSKYLPARVFIKKEKTTDMINKSAKYTPPVSLVTSSTVPVAEYEGGSCEPIANTNVLSSECRTTGPSNEQVNCEGTSMSKGCKYTPSSALSSICRGSHALTESKVLAELHHCSVLDPGQASVNCGCIENSRVYQQQILDNCTVRNQYQGSQSRLREEYNDIKESYDHIYHGYSLWSVGGAPGATAWLDTETHGGGGHTANMPSGYPGWVTQWRGNLIANQIGEVAFPPLSEGQMTAGLHHDIKAPTCCINSIAAQGSNLDNVHQCMICPGSLSPGEAASVIAACHRNTPPDDGGAPGPSASPLSNDQTIRVKKSGIIKVFLIGMSIIIALWVSWMFIKVFTRTPVKTKGYST